MDLARKKKHNEQLLTSSENVGTLSLMSLTITTSVALTVLLVMSGS